MSSLSHTLLGLATWYQATLDGTHCWTQDGREAFATALHRAAHDAEVLEFGMTILQAQQEAAPDTALVEGVSSGKVTILPTPRALVAHGYRSAMAVPFGDGA